MIKKEGRKSMYLGCNERRETILLVCQTTTKPKPEGRAIVITIIPPLL